MHKAVKKYIKLMLNEQKKTSKPQLLILKHNSYKVLKIAEEMQLYHNENKSNYITHGPMQKKKDKEEGESLFKCVKIYFRNLLRSGT